LEWECSSCAKKINYWPKEIAIDTLGHVIGYWLLETIIIHHQVIDEFMGIHTYFIHVTWNSFHNFFWPWPSLKFWISSKHYWHPPNIGTRCIHQTSKPKFHYFYWTNSHGPCLWSHNWQMPRTYPSRVILGLLLHPFQWNSKKNNILYVVSITSEMFSRLASS
jgi:hypothetical protein